MHLLFWIIPLSVGAMTVLQGTLNRQMSEPMGLGAALLVNSVIVTVAAAALYGAARLQPSLVPAIFHDSFEPRQLRAWMILPGLFGFGIIAGIPWGITRLGAAKVFVGIVVAQLVVSMIWDTFIDGRPITWMRVVGASMAILGVIIVSMDRS